MTDIDAKALALLNEVRTALGSKPFSSINRLFAAHAALCRAIEAHEADKVAHASQIYAMHSRIAQAEEELEAYKQKVSDAVEEYYSRPYDFPAISQSFIIPKPKPDPLVEVLDAMKDGRAGPTTESYAACLRAALDARGLEIREKGQ